MVGCAGFFVFVKLTRTPAPGGNERVTKDIHAIQVKG